MLCQLPPPVFFDHFPDLFHPLDHEHPGFSKVLFRSISIFIQECVVLCVKGIYGVQQTGKMIVYASPPDKRVSVCVRFNLCPIDVEFFQCNESFLLQAAHKLVVQFIQDFARQFFPFKVIKSIPLGLLPFRQPSFFFLMDKFQGQVRSAWITPAPA